MTQSTMLPLLACFSLLACSPDTASEQDARPSESYAAESGTVAYRHATGLSFDHPADWSVELTPSGGLKLMPSDVLSLKGQAGEVLSLTGKPAAGIESAADARVSAYVIRLVRGVYPYLRLADVGEVYSAGDRTCVEHRFTGDHAGTEFTATAQVTILADTVMVGFALTPTHLHEHRRCAMDRIFRSLRMLQPGSRAFGKLSRDPNLTGRWVHTQNYNSGSFTSILVHRLHLSADGTCEEGSRVMAGMSQTGEAIEARGIWRTEGSQLVIHWDSGETTIISYEANAKSMLWSKSQRRKLWERV